MQLVFARQYFHRCNELHFFNETRCEIFGVSNAAGKQNIVYFAVDRYGVSGDITGDLIDQRVIDQFRLFVAFVNTALHFAGVVSAQMRHKTALASQQLFNVVQTALFNHFSKLHRLHRASPFRRKRPVAVQRVVYFHNLAFRMAAYGNAAAQVRYNQVQLFIRLALLGGKTLGYRFLVKGMENTLPRHLRQTSKARHRRQLVNNHRVYNESRTAGFLRQKIGQHAAQIGSVNAVLAALQIREHRFIHGISAADNWL